MSPLLQVTEKPQQNTSFVIRAFPLMSNCRVYTAEEQEMMKY